jgi:hypothetical protein
MMRPSAHRGWITIAWAVVGLGVTGAVWLALRSPSPPADAGPPVSERIVKSRNRERLPDLPPDFGEAVRVLAARRPSPQRDQALAHSLSQWADHDPREAEEWLLAFPGGELREWLVCAAVTAIAQHDPVKATSLLEAELTEGLARNHAIVAIVQRWAQRSPEAARELVDRLDPPSARQDARREINAIETAVARLRRAD